jgi:histone H3/H4
MPSEYILTKPAIDFNRLQKIAKKLLDESSEDRNLALETMRYFKDMIEDNPTDAAAKSLMVDCLKLAQSSKDKTIKVIDMLLKIESSKTNSMTKASGKGSGKSIFDTLDEITND